ncbi:MAG: DUF1345 domain-containing protein [Methyloceanibacter sp.]|nr:DUF1345 domain-containing protein [Methyloceanibacter sp.]
MAPRGQATKPRENNESPWAALARHLYAQWRFLDALAVGVAVALVVPLEDAVPRVLAGWNAGGLVYLVLVGIKMWQAEVEGIKREASIERESRIVVLVVVIFGSIFTMLALFVQLMAIKSEQGIDRTLSIGLSVFTIILSWLLIHTVFAVYYAHEFHSEAKGGSRGQGGGLKFPDDSTPDYLDFLYFSFVVGTTAQTSDVEVCSRAMRRVVMLHGILSFFFNTAVIALAVNLAAQLVQG